MDRTVTAIAALTILILAGIIGYSVKAEKNFQPRSQCVEHSLGLSMHIHPELAILMDGQPVTAPANVGIDPTCMKALHTHDNTGKIHIEYPERHDFTLGDFFANWGQALSKDQIMDKKVDATHTLTMTVDDQPSTDFEKLILKDGQKIVIHYDSKK